MRGRRCSGREREAVARRCGGNDGSPTPGMAHAMDLALKRSARTSRLGERDPRLGGRAAPPLRLPEMRGEMLARLGRGSVRRDSLARCIVVGLRARGAHLCLERLGSHDSPRSFGHRRTSDLNGLAAGLRSIHAGLFRPAFRGHCSRVEGLAAVASVTLIRRPCDPIVDRQTSHGSPFRRLSCAEPGAQDDSSSSVALAQASRLALQHVRTRLFSCVGEVSQPARAESKVAELQKGARTV